MKTTWKAHGFLHVVAAASNWRYAAQSLEAEERSADPVEYSQGSRQQLHPNNREWPQAVQTKRAEAAFEPALFLERKRFWKPQPLSAHPPLALPHTGHLHC
ncbi:hypothetical protein O6H91_Y432400 [Diphasiastrum complanatum]|nr:hypothetical protein O6H91_Y432400 [Diphasiastrum complanatum]